VPADTEQDWGESSGAVLAKLREDNNHKRFELQFQIWVLLLLSTFAIILVLVDVSFAKNGAKDLIVVVLPAFTFVLGKLDKRNG
jgi:hypothetical protein